MTAWRAEPGPEVSCGGEHLSPNVSFGDLFHLTIDYSKPLKFLELCHVV